MQKSERRPPQVARAGHPVVSEAWRLAMAFLEVTSTVAAGLAVAAIGGAVALAWHGGDTSAVKGLASGGVVAYLTAILTKSAKSGKEDMK